MIEVTPLKMAMLAVAVTIPNSLQDRRDIIFYTTFQAVNASIKCDRYVRTITCTQQ